MRLVVVGGGLAGCEAAWQAARRGMEVALYEMKPVRFSPAHQSEGFAGLVCSNSLRSNSQVNAVGLLKEEMRRLGSLVMEAADESAIPAGRALAVDREAFSRRITDSIESHPRIEIRREVVERIPPDGRVILATGPLTAGELARDLQQLLGDEHLYFCDAQAPILYADSIDHDVAFRASRWEDGPGDYLNLPLDAAAYRGFVESLLLAETVPLHPFEAQLYFEGCLPIEEMARRGRDTLRFGPMKPVGLTDPNNPTRRSHAVVQLRQDNALGTLYNMVGFQTKLKYGAQADIFRAIPGLEKAEFARLGGLHRNTFLNSPELLDGALRLKAQPRLRFAGQITGVEGYVESAAIGLLAGRYAAAERLDRALAPPPATTAHGALLNHITGGHLPGDRIEPGPRRFQPRHVNFGLFPPCATPEGKRVPKKARKPALAARALADLDAWMTQTAAAAE